MTYKFNVGDFVWLRLKSREQFRIKVLERTNGRYRLDWGSCGFNPILNTVRIAESAMHESDTEVHDCNGGNLDIPLCNK